MRRFLVFAALAVAILLIGFVAFWRYYRQSGPYGQTFFQTMNRSAERSATVAVPEIIRLLKPNSVVDVGSGEGFWSKAFLDNGVKDVTAVDGPWVRSNELKIPPANFISQDFSDRLILGRTFDLVLCLETAEHLRPERADSFVTELTKLAPMVVFSAAVPGQGGTFHINEQWQTYWAERFAKNSYVAIDIFRPMLWNNRELAAMYRQNMVLYVSPEVLTKRPDLKDRPAFPGGILSLVHPEVFQSAVSDAAYASRWQTKLKRALGVE